ncbi:multidrug effflux MFS transporter [Modestobacter altitudinis]|uniref:multidrug effflux MFS transporter n=1 Tax=Modestobacter altitudinis TaxID=2213158 RepID=UPI00110C94E6|nr:multidrug effflux MFS transporter [Modestobacter altitudinis]
MGRDRGATGHAVTARPERQTGLVALLGFLSAFGPLSMDLYLPALPRIQTGLATGQSPVQLTLSAVALGLAVGQLIAGPLSDRFGRRGPLLVGIGTWALASLLCALSPTIWTLIAIRLVQGMGGSAGIVLARAIVRDRTGGMEAARVFAVLASILGGAPVLAPVIGGQLLRVTDWRGLFVFLAGTGLVLLLVTYRTLPETLPPERRVTGGLRTTLVNGRTLIRRRAFVAAVLAQACGYGALFTYISGSPFALQTGYGLSAQQFSLLFAVNGAGMVVAAQASRLLVQRAGPRRLLLAGLTLQVVAGASLLAAAVTGAGVAVVLTALFVLVSANGLVLPNATALAMADSDRMAGSAAALLGVTQFTVAGIGAPLIGLGTAGTLLPVAVVVSAFAALGTAAAAAAPAGRSPASA